MISYARRVTPGMGLPPLTGRTIVGTGMLVDYQGYVIQALVADVPRAGADCVADTTQCDVLRWN